MVMSNQDAPLKIDIGDSRIVCFDVSSRCRDNIPYFDRLGEILDHPDAPGVVMSYLLNRDISNWKPGKIPVTKMKVKTMREQLSNPIRFIIDYIASWGKDEVAKPSCTSLYQKYLEWCEENGEKSFSNNIAGKKFSEIGIESKRASGGKREWQYILDRSKIVTKLCESDLGDIEEFSDLLQTDLATNDSAEIPVFDMPEVSPKPTLVTPNIDKVKNVPLPSDKKADKLDDITQSLFNYMAEHVEAPVASTLGTSETFKASKIPEPSNTSELFEPEIDKPASTKLFEPTGKISPPILLSRTQREECLKKKAIKLGEDPDKFVTITDEDKRNSISFRYKMEADARMCSYAKGEGEDPHEHMDMTVRERLIGEEVIRQDLENEGVMSSWLDTDEEWKKVISILQENGMLW